MQKASLQPKHLEIIPPAKKIQLTGNLQLLRDNLPPRRPRKKWTAHFEYILEDLKFIWCI